MRTDSPPRRDTVPVVVDRVRDRVVNRTHDETVKAATVAGFVVLLVGVLAMHGFLWGQSQPMLQTILDAGAIKCLHDQGLGALAAHCNAVGQPVGLTLVTGLPQTMLGWALSWVPGVDPWAAHQILNAILDAVALAGGYLLLRRWSVVRPIALLAAAVYLVSPSLLGLDGFLYTFTGYTFLPLYVLLFLKGIDGFERDGSPRAGAAWLTGVAFLMVFTDGYSYVTALVLIGCVLLWWLVANRGTSGARKTLAAGVFALANLVAVAAYTAYVNVPTEHYDLGRFRLLGLDVVTLFVPQQTLLWPSHVGYTAPTLHLWGDGGNYLHNYMGYGMLAIVAWLLVGNRLRGRPRSHRRELMALFVGALIALFLSFGPALKFDAHSYDPTATEMPLGKTVVGLPTSLIYGHLQPFTTMRAAFRFSVAFRFFLVFGAAYAMSVVWRSGRRGLAIVLMLVASIEVLPAPRLYYDMWRAQARKVSAVRADVLPEFDTLTHRGERILLLPASNDFLVNAMAPFAGVSTYNVGIDKSYYASSAKWPTDVQAAIAGIMNPADQGERIAAVLHHDADAVVICYFDMHTGGTTWPAPAPNVAYLHQQAAALSHDPRFVTRQGKLMTVVRLRTGAGRVTG
jgi:hypothetical protein